ncbi:MAG: cytochrome bc1 complex cytochrome b subunit [Acidimicrobiales bacterium]
MSEGEATDPDAMGPATAEDDGGRRRHRRRSRGSPIEAGVHWIDDRLGVSRFTQTVLDKIFPDHWSFMIGEIALYCFVVLVGTGIYLTFFFSPSSQVVIYHGSYRPLQGLPVSAAFNSVLNISFGVRAGLVMRQMHHWAALVFLAAIVVHLCRIFFTGAFRRPREVNWIIGVTLLVLAMANGFTGYSLPDDLLSGTGLRIAYSIVLSVPLVGSWLGFLFFGGKFPGTDTIQRFFVIHVLLVPALIAVFLTAHLAILWHQKHTDFPGPGKSETTIHGSRLWPQYAVKSMALFCFVVAVLAGLGGLAQINPIWIYGPYQPAAVTSASQPDWYIGWLEGALRIMPPWEIRVFHHSIPNPFFPGVLLPSITFGMLYAWPFLERHFTKDNERHNLLDRPRDRPLRSAFGVSTMTFYAILFLAGATDVLAPTFGLSFQALVHLFQVAVFLLPAVMGLLTWRVMKELSRQRTHPIQQPVGGRIRRTPTGGYELEEPPPDGHQPGDGSAPEAAAPDQALEPS